MHDPETHLIPLVLQAATGRIPHIDIFGNDYQTRDGTCVRDYVHVIDLARAHILALEILDEKSEIYNLGCGGAGRAASGAGVGAGGGGTAGKRCGVGGTGADGGLARISRALECPAGAGGFETLASGE